jgi:hypothetical protein
MKLVLEPGGHAEVAAAATQCPEQVGVGRIVGGQQLAVSRDDLDGQQVVDGQAVLAHGVADAAAQRQAGYANRAGIAEADQQLALPRRLRNLERGQAGARPDRLIGFAEFE